MGKRLRTDSFIGRRPELTELSEALAGSRFILLAGPAGVGKTRLAQELAGSIRSRYADGVHMVELAPVTDADLVTQAVAGVLGIWQQPGRSPIESLIAGLRRREALLLLDNCEHLASACAELATTLLTSCPALSIVATSQMRLGVAGELTWQIRPLSLPDKELSEDSLAASEAVTLFCERASLAQPGFSARGERLAAVGEICRHLDGIPLAVELAAALVTVVTPVQLAARLGERFSILNAREGRAGEERHSTLRSAVEWSYNLLSPVEQMVLRRSAVFAGSWTRDAALDVCSEGTDEAEAGRALAALAGRSLLLLDDLGGEERYTLLETIRLYAADRLAAAGEVDATRARHACWYGSLAERAVPSLVGPDQAVWFERLETAKHNCRAALAWMRAREEAGPMLRLAGALIMFWRIRGYFREGRDWLDSALSLNGEVDVPLRAKALWGLGFLSIMLSDDRPGTDALEQSLAMALETSDHVVEGRSLMLIGNHLMFVRRDRAVPVLAQSIAVARGCGDRWCLGHALALLGKTHVEVGHPQEGRLAFEECVAMGRRGSDLQTLKIGLACFGDGAVLWGDYAEAEGLLDEAIDVSQRLGDPYTVAVATTSLGEVALYRGKYEKAVRLLKSGLAGAGDTGNAASAMNTLCLLGAVYQALGNIAAARDCFAGAMETADGIGRRCAPALRGLGEIAIMEKQWNNATDLLAEAMTVAATSRSERARAAILTALGALAFEQGDLRGAMSHLQAALRAQRKMGAKGMAIDVIEAVALVLAECGPVDRAATLLVAADQLRRRHGHVRPPSHRGGYDEACSSTSRNAGEMVNSGLWIDGSAMTLQEAMDCALRPMSITVRSGRGWGGLSRTEQKVARLAADGLTNREIGERLFISPRTAETHLTHIFAKLRIRGRNELMRAVIAMGDQAR